MTGTELKATREGLGWSRQQLAEKMGLTYNAVFRYETGSRKIGAMAAELLRRIFTDAQKVDSVQHGGSATAPNDTRPPSQQS